MEIEFPDSYEYNLDMRIAHVIVAGIPELRGKGYPASLTPEEWDQILTDIEEGFKEYRDMFNQMSFDTSKFNRAMNLLNEWFPSLWW